ncbi:MAG: thiol reductant ABC exporter subunit CydC, partial [Stackebrandtia sp.]
MSVFRVLGLIRGYLPRVALAGLVAALGELAGIALIATATWLLATAAQQPPLPVLTTAIVAVRAFAIGRGLLRYLDRLVGHDAVLRALAQLRGTVFRAVTPLAPMGAKLFRGGDLLTRLVSDVDAVQDLLLRVLVPAWTALIVGAAMVGFTAAFSPEAALVVAAGLLLSGLALPLLAGTLAIRAARRTVTRRAALATSTVDLIHG